MLQPLRAFPGDGPAIDRLGYRHPRGGTVLTPCHPTPLARIPGRAICRLETPVSCCAAGSCLSCSSEEAACGKLPNFALSPAHGHPGHAVPRLGAGGGGGRCRFLLAGSLGAGDTLFCSRLWGHIGCHTLSASFEISAGRQRQRRGSAGEADGDFPLHFWYQTCNWVMEAGRAAA